MEEYRRIPKEEVTRDQRKKWTDHATRVFMHLLLILSVLLMDWNQGLNVGGGGGGAGAGTAGVGGLRLVCGCLFQVAPAWTVHSDDEL